MIQHALHTFGGRRIEGPRGGTPPPPKLWQGFWGYICISWDEVVERQWEESRGESLRLGAFAFLERL